MKIQLTILNNMFPGTSVLDIRSGNIRIIKYSWQKAYEINIGIDANEYYNKLDTLDCKRLRKIMRKWIIARNAWTDLGNV